MANHKKNNGYVPWTGGLDKPERKKEDMFAEAEVIKSCIEQLLNEEETEEYSHSDGSEETGILNGENFTDMGEMDPSLAQTMSDLHLDNGQQFHSFEPFYQNGEIVSDKLPRSHAAAPNLWYSNNNSLPYRQPEAPVSNGTTAASQVSTLNPNASPFVVMNPDAKVFVPSSNPSNPDKQSQ